MLIRARDPRKLKENRITPETVYLRRRQILAALGLGAANAALAPRAGALDLFGSEVRDGEYRLDAPNHQDPRPDWEQTPEDKAISFNNFYEFGADKTDPARNSRDFQVEPWTLKIGGHVEKPQTLDVWELIHGAALEERIYRLRCVEAWSMVIPWIGLELNTLLKRAQPTSRAKFVAFRTLHDPQQMPALRKPWLGGGISFPYREGLRMDEAMHPLAFLAVGMYGKTLPPQNGAPIRLVVPWKYGFKSIKSIVRIDLVEKKPPTAWAMLSPQEYGFYANVNPEEDHPRWSQATEKFIGEGFVATRQETLPYNGYAEAVADLYR